MILRQCWSPSRSDVLGVVSLHSDTGDNELNCCYIQEMNQVLPSHLDDFNYSTMNTVHNYIIYYLF